MTLKLSKITKNDYKAVKKLYLSAFPREERPPFFMLKSGVKKGSGDFFVAKDGEIFVGFAYIVTHADLAYLFYFAIDGGLRGKGYGSAVHRKALLEYGPCPIHRPSFLTKILANGKQI